jgi:hypothetical protein
MIRQRAEYNRLAGLAVLLVIALPLHFGCSSKNLKLEGQTATQQDNISLKEGGPHEGQWKSGDMVVNYTYSNQADSFNIEGTVALTRRLTNTFRMVSQFQVRVNLLDEEKIILSSVPVVIAGNSPIRTWTFTEEFPAPPGAGAMNFSYSGSASESGGGPFGARDQVTTTFWLNP